MGQDDLEKSVTFNWEHHHPTTMKGNKMKTVRSDIATRKAKNFLRDCKATFESKPMRNQVMLINQISGNKRRDKKAMERLTNHLPAVVALERCSTPGKFKGMWFPIYGRVDYDLTRMCVETEFEHGDTALTMMAKLPDGNRLMCSFSYHAIKRMFERYDDLLNMHNNQDILHQMFLIFRDLNCGIATRTIVDTGRFEVQDRVMVWSTLGSGMAEQGYLIKTFLPKEEVNERT